jgi:hypothetical protein
MKIVGWVPRSLLFFGKGRVTAEGWGLAQPYSNTLLDAPPVAVSRVGRDAMGSGDFADMKLCLPGFIDRNRTAFAIDVNGEGLSASKRYNRNSTI